MKNKKPLVSVIVTAYNQERFIGRCLRSLLNQTMPLDDYEVIVVNDGSTDRTGYALELFHDAIRVITNQGNLGLPASLNRGIAISKSPYLVRVDSDDYVNENFLKFLYYFLDQNPEMDAIACDYWIYKDEEIWLERYNCEEYPIACGILFRKNQLEEVGLYDESFRLNEEKELRIRFEKKYRVHRLELPLYRYHRHEGNMTNDQNAMDSHFQKMVKKHKLPSQSRSK